MSEKRFSIESTATELELYDEDIQIAEFPHYEWVAKSVDYIVDLLNDLNDENERLRQILKDIVVATDETYTKNTSMFKVTVVLDYEKYREIRRSIE